MSFFTKKNFLYKLIVCICIVLTLINSTGVQNVYAADKKDGSGIGGVLITPICDILLGLSDAIMNIVQKSIVGTDATINVDNKTEFNWGAFFLAALAVIVVAVLWIVPGTQGIAAAVTTAAIKAALAYGALNLVTAGGLHAVVTAVASEVLDDIVVLPTYTIGPQEIFSGRILLFDANIFNPKSVEVEYNVMDYSGEEPTVTSKSSVPLEEWNKTYKYQENNKATGYYYTDDDGKRVGTSINNSAYELRDVIAKWYYIIRTIALISSMLILLYIGLRIIISSVAEEKSKYKQMLVDWVVGLCLMVVLHYIMIFSHNIVDGITSIFNTYIDENSQIAIISVDKTDDAKLIEAVEKIEQERGITVDHTDEEGYIFDKEGLLTIRWPTNMMGRFRVEAQNKSGSVEYFGYAIAYLALVLFTLIFSFTYIKRLLYLLFLTVIAPFVALTYPIDKIHDGKAQAFDMWLKEYIFNLLIQPFHLLLYTIFVTMAFDLAGTNVIYSLVVIGFMVPAEKFLRTMFGFNKSSTSDGLFAGAGGAALAMSAVSSLRRFANGGGNGKKDSGDKKDGKSDSEKLRTADSDKTQRSLFNELAGGDDSDNGNGNGPTSPAPDQDSNQEQPEDPALAAYRNEGYGQNADGHYFNPMTDEYDEDYDPRNDDTYSQQINTQGEPGSVSEPEIEQEPQSIETNQTEQSSLQTNTNSEKKDGKFKRFLRASGRGAWNVAKQSAVRELKAAPRSLLRVATSAATATTLGAVGLASGIVSGDMNTAFKNTTAGVATGAAVGAGVANRVANLAGGYDKKAKEQWQKDYYGEEYDKKMKEKADKEFMKDKEIRALYQEKLKLKNKDEVDKAMREAKKYREYGVNDNNIIIKAMNSKNASTTDRASKERIAAARLAENSKTVRDLETHMNYFNKTPGMSKKQSERIERMIREINNL